MAKHVRIVSVALASLMASSVAVAAAAELECKPFETRGSDAGREAYNVDINDDGAPSSGDKRIGFRQMVDADGAPIGQRYFTGTFQKFDADGKELDRVTETVSVFANGSLFATKQKRDGVDLGSIIVGGTGVFAGATGTVEVTRDGDTNVYHYNVTCTDNPQS